MITNEHIEQFIAQAHRVGCLLYTSQNYRKLILFLARESKYPKETCDYFRKYCADHQLECEIIETLDDREVHSGDRKSTCLNSSHSDRSRMPSSA